MKHTQEISWEYSDTVDTVYGERDADIEVEAVVTFEDLEPVSATITTCYAYLMDSDGGCTNEEELESPKLMAALELEAIERARGLVDREDLELAEGDAEFKSYQENGD